MPLHDDLLAALEAVAEVALVAKLRDPRLRFPDETRLNVFIPDIHLVTPRRAYNFGTNAPELLASTIGALRDFRTGAAPAQVVVYQLGDLIDLWREADGLTPNADVASAIEDAHAELVETLYDPALDAQFLLGNHDYDLYRWTNYDVWQRYFYLLPSILVLHGDIFDWVEKLPDGLKNFFVHLFSPAAKPGRAQLEAMRPLNEAMRRLATNARRLPLRAMAAPGTIPGDRFNVQDAQSPPEMLRFFDAARAKRSEANREFGLALTTLVIGHTHHARLVVEEQGDELFALVDCGAWIEDCVTEDDPTARPNAQIAALGADEIRIYQLAPR